MAIKVMIERTVRPGMENILPNMLRNLRSEAVRQQGYIYGETWRSVLDPATFLVVATWGNLESWERWEKDPYRQRLESQIQELLVEKSTIRVFEEYFETTGVLTQSR